MKLRTAAIVVAVVTLISASTAVVALAVGESPDWQAVRTEAVKRIGTDHGGDAAGQLADGIANDVTGRGTVWMFMIGDDSGVVYGVGPTAVQPELLVKVETKTKTKTRTIYVSVSPTNTVLADAMLTLPSIGDKEATVGLDVLIPLPEASGGNGPYMYTVSGLPTGLEFDTGQLIIRGMTTMTPGVYSVTYIVKDDKDMVLMRFKIHVQETEPTIEETEPTIEETEPTIEETEPTFEETEPTFEGG